MLSVVARNQTNSDPKVDRKCRQFVYTAEVKDRSLRTLEPVASYPLSSETYPLHTGGFGFIQSTGLFGHQAFMKLGAIIILHQKLSSSFLLWLRLGHRSREHSRLVTDYLFILADNFQ